MTQCKTKYKTLLDLARQSKIKSGQTACFEGRIKSGIPFSDYPSGIDLSTSLQTGIGDSQSAVFSGNSYDTIFDLANPSSPNYNPAFSGSTFSGVTWTNPLFTDNLIYLTLPISTISGDTTSQFTPIVWDLSETGMNGEHEIELAYSGFNISYQLEELYYDSSFPHTESPPWVGSMSATIIYYSAGTLDYRGPLDYISSEENISVKNKLISNKLQVIGGASATTIGYVLKQIDAEGNVGWGPDSSGGTITDVFVTGGTLSTDNNLTLTYNNGGNTSPIDLNQIKFTGNTSGNCISEVWVDRIYGCVGSDLNIEVENSGNTINLRGTSTVDRNLGIRANPILDGDSSLFIRGISSTSTGAFDKDNTSLRVVNNTDENILLVKNDKTVSINGNFNGFIGGTAALNIYGSDAGIAATTNVLTLKDSNTNTIGTVGSDARFRFGTSLENTLVKIGNSTLTGEDAKLHISPSTNPGGGNTWPTTSDYMLKIDGFENTGAPWTSYVSNIFNVDNFGNVNSVGKITAGELEINKVGDNAKLFTFFDDTSPGYRISGNTDNTLVYTSVNTPGGGGMSWGCRGLTEPSFPGYGKQGDGFIYSSMGQNGLNIISQPSSPQTTDDYVRFYVGQNTGAEGTADLHIQGSGATRGFVGIQNESPTVELDVNGDVKISGSLTVGSTNTITLDASADPSVGEEINVVFYSSASPGGSINLASSYSGREVKFVRTSTTNSVTLAGVAGSLINGAATKALPTILYSTTTCVCDGTDWYCTSGIIL